MRQPNGKRETPADRQRANNINGIIIVMIMMGNKNRNRNRNIHSMQASEANRRVAFQIECLESQTDISSSTYRSLYTNCATRDRREREIEGDVRTQGGRKADMRQSGWSGGEPYVRNLTLCSGTCVALQFSDSLLSLVSRLSLSLAHLHTCQTSAYMHLTLCTHSCINKGDLALWYMQHTHRRYVSLMHP